MEDEKAWLTSKCPKEQQATYELAKDTKLVGILSDVLHPTYKRCITKLMDTNKLLLMAKGEAVPNYDSYEPGVAGEERVARHLPPRRREAAPPATGAPPVLPSPPPGAVPAP